MVNTTCVSFLALWCLTVALGSSSPIAKQVRLLASEVKKLQREVPNIQLKLANDLEMSEATLRDLIERKVKEAVDDVLEEARKHMNESESEIRTEIDKLQSQVVTLQSEKQSCENRLSRIFTSETEHVSLLMLGLRRDLNVANTEVSKLKDDFFLFKSQFGNTENDSVSANANGKKFTNYMLKSVDRLSEDVDRLNKSHESFKRCEVTVNVSMDAEWVTRRTGKHPIESCSNETVNLAETDTDRVVNIEKELRQVGEELDSVKTIVNETLIRLARIETRDTFIDTNTKNSTESYSSSTTYSSPTHAPTTSTTPNRHVEMTKVLITDTMNSIRTYFRQLTIENNQVTTYPHLKLRYVEGIAYDPTRHQIIFGSHTPPGIYASPVNTSTILTMQEGIRSGSLAVDADIATVFCTTYHPTYTVSRISTDGRNFSTVCSLKKFGKNPTGLALDMTKRMIYIAKQDMLLSVDYEGRAVKVLKRREPSYDIRTKMHGVAVDSTRGVLYYSVGARVYWQSLSVDFNIDLGAIDSTISALLYYNNTVYISSDVNGHIHQLYYTPDTGTAVIKKVHTSQVRKSTDICLMP